MPSQRSRRRSRKARGKAGAAPRAATSPRREQRALRQTEQERQSATAARTLGTVGERPVSPFGGLPVSEVAIFAGLVAIVVGVVAGGPALIVGVIVLGLGVTEVTAREHFSGYRSHSSLLAAIPAVLVEGGVVVLLGTPSNRGLLILPVVVVFALCFWLLRRSFATARHARVVRPPSA